MVNSGMGGIMNNIDLSKISVKEFVGLLERLDKTEPGKNLFLRCYPDGGSYISNDNGTVDHEFFGFEGLIAFLRTKTND
jgi:hypothetical protein